MLCRPLRPPLDARADRGGRAVEDADAIALDELPPDALVRVVGCALPHHRGGSVAERAVDDVGVTRHPADVCGAPVDVAPGLQVEDVTVDRKSTRLNSSHITISYAVFCLKKKKI